jgi:hypothetical protein
MSWIPTWLRPIPAPNSKLNDEAPTPALPKSTEPAPQQQSYALVSSQSPPPATSTTLSKTVEEETDAGPIVAIPFTGFALGFGAGVYQSAKRASLVFMAENAHRRPDTVQGWYFYNKTKVSGGPVLSSWYTLLTLSVSFLPSYFRTTECSWLALQEDSRRERG